MFNLFSQNSNSKQILFYLQSLLAHLKFRPNKNKRFSFAFPYIFIPFTIIISAMLTKCHMWYTMFYNLFKKISSTIYGVYWIINHLHFLLLPNILTKQLHVLFLTALLSLISILSQGVRAFVTFKSKCNWAHFNLHQYH